MNVFDGNRRDSSLPLMRVPLTRVHVMRIVVKDELLVGRLLHIAHDKWPVSRWLLASKDHCREHWHVVTAYDEVLVARQPLDLLQRHSFIHDQVVKFLP